MNVWHWIVALSVAAILVVGMSGRWPIPGRWQIVTLANPGDWPQFYLLDTAKGRVWRCDPTGCMDVPTKH